MIEKIEPIILVLCGMAIFFTLAIFLGEKWFNNDAQLFQVFSNVLSGVVGAILMRVKPAATHSSSTEVNIKAEEKKKDN